jgi:tetratricopeptide (TPR) repeat protein
MTGRRTALALALASSLVFALTSALFSVGAAPAGAEVHSHYEQLLERGTFTLEAGEGAEAARLLRLACFGMLEDPPALADCLTRLALAQAAAGDDEGFGDTFRRLVEVEERFDGYADAESPAGMRAAFEAEAAARIPARVLAATPSFARLLPAEPGESEGEAAAGAAPVRPLVPNPPDVEPDRTAEAAAAPDAGLTPGEQDGQGLSPEEREQLDRARELLAAARDRGALDEPARLARQVADANPESREAQHLAAVIAYRAARWEEAVRYFRQGGDPGDASPERLFYYAVSLYEAGEREEAADVLRRSLPRLEHTPFVRSYQSKILGESS